MIAAVFVRSSAGFCIFMRISQFRCDIPRFSVHFSSPLLSAHWAFSWVTVTVIVGSSVADRRCDY